MELTTGKCGVNVSFEFNSESGVLTISGRGNMYEFSGKSGYWSYMGEREECVSYFEDTEGIKKVIINEGVSSIGSRSFLNCADLEEVVIANSILSINESAFAGCKKLKAITIPSDAALKKIGKKAFFNCERLKELVLNSAVEEIGEAAFDTCSELDRVVLSDSIKEIEKFAFADCRSIKELDFPVGLDTIGNCAFCRCVSLKSIDIPDSVEHLGEGAFCFCTSLESAVVSGGIIMLDEQTFEGCTALERVIIKDYFDEALSIKAIRKNCFKDCINLKKIFFPNNLKRIESNAFKGCYGIEEVYWSSLDCAENIGFMNIGIKNAKNYFCKYENFGGFLEFKKNTAKPMSEYWRNTDNIFRELDDGGDFHYDMDRETGEVVIRGFGGDIRDFKNYGSGIYTPFYRDSSIKRVYIKAGVGRIGNNTFFGCGNLEYIELPNRLESIGENAFAGTAVKEILFDGSLAEWERIEISPGNKELENVTVIFGKYSLFK